jgi:serine/threonine protein kinase
MSMENMLVTEDRRSVIIDLGMCLRLPIDESIGRCYLTPPRGCCGKKNYISPEILQNTHSFDGFCVDIWAAGIILFMLLTGVPPVETASPLDARYRAVVSGQIGRMLSGWGMAISDEAVDLIQNMLRERPSDRYTIEKIRNHPWIANHL